MKIIKVKKNKAETHKVKKISLSWFDDKRYILDDGFHTLAYFHKDLRKQEDILKDSYTWSWIRKDSHKRSCIRRDCSRQEETLIDKNKCTQIEISECYKKIAATFAKKNFLNRGR